MFKEVIFDLKASPSTQFNASERQLILHIYRKYLNNKFFYTPVFSNSDKNRIIARLERSYNLRMCILYFYCNPLYRHPFDNHTLQNLFEKLKRSEQHCLIGIPDPECKKQYFLKDAELPVFLLYGDFTLTSVPYNLNLLYQEILDLENRKESIHTSLQEKASKLITTLYFIVRLPFVQLLRRIKFSKSVTNRFRHFESISSLWKTINILSFQINYFIFKKGIREIIQGKSELADLSSLVMLIGDDFIDQIARKKGCKTIISIFNSKKDPFEIKINDDFTLQSDDLILLYKSLHIEKEKVSDKDSMTFDQLYEVMTTIFSEINARLLTLSRAKRETACKSISSYLNYCLSTYMDDLLFSTLENEKKCNLNNTRWYFYKKNNCVMMYGLWLRATLLDLRYENFLPQIREWGSLVENIQLYDDLRDMIPDWNYQPNYAHILSFGYFRDEHEWFENNIHTLSGDFTASEIAEICIAMPKTVAHTMLISKYMGITHLDWFTRFATNYCWKQNWTFAFLILNSFKRNPKLNLTTNRALSGFCDIFTTCSKAVNLVFSLMTRTVSLYMNFRMKEFYFDYLLMICLHDSNFSKQFYYRTNILHTYNLTFRFQFMKTGYRAKLLNQFMKQYKNEVVLASEQWEKYQVPTQNKLPVGLSEYILKNWAS